MKEKAQIPPGHHLPSPKVCPCCNSTKVRLTDNSELYGKRYGTWPLIYLCDNCKASVSCHKGTNVPMGYMADRKTKIARSNLHKCFDPLWKLQRYSSRTEMYSWLSQVMGIESVECHISRFTFEQCSSAIRHCKAMDRFMKSNKKVTIYDYLQSI